MKLKDNFVLRQVADAWVAMPIGKGMLNFDGMLTLNETGMLLWKKLEQGAELDTLAAAMTAEYDVSLETAYADAKKFCELLDASGCLEYDIPNIGVSEEQ